MASIWFVLPILAIATAWMYFLTLIAPKVKVDHGDDGGLSFPSSLQELQALAVLLRLYYERNWLYVLVLYSSAYLYKQTFAIPGTVFLNVLGGTLFGVFIGFPLCCVLTACGASCCYLLSATCGHDLVAKHLSRQLKSFQDKVTENKDQLLYYLLFLRMFPMSPNWLINVIAPLVGIPLRLFFITVLIGLIPYVLICVQAGVVLSSLHSLDELFSVKTLLQMATMAVAALAPSFLFKRRRSQTQEQ